MRRIYTIMIVLFAMLLLNSCAYSGSTNEYETLDVDHNLTEEIQKPSGTFPVNSVGNTLHGGFFFEYNDILYGKLHSGYRDTDKPDIVYSTVFAKLSYSPYIIGKDDPILPSETNVTLLTENPSKNICVYKDKIYYIDEDVSVELDVDTKAPISNNYGLGRIYTMNLDGSENIPLSQDTAEMYYIYNDFIYYTHIESDGDLIDNGRKMVPQYSKTYFYQMNVDGSNKILLYEIEDRIENISMAFDKIYFYILNEDSNIMELDIKTREVCNVLDKIDVSEMTDFQYAEINRSENYLYFKTISNPPIKTDFYRINIETKKLENLKQFSDLSMGSYHLDEEWLYVVAKKDSFFKVRHDDLNDKVILLEDDFGFMAQIQIAGNNIYFTKDHRYFYHTTLADGSTVHESPRLEFYSVDSDSDLKE